MTSPLSPPNGYTFTITHLSGGRPNGSIACLSCTWQKPITIPLSDGIAALGAVVFDAVRDFISHPHRGYVGTDIKEQGEPAPRPPIRQGWGN